MTTLITYNATRKLDKLELELFERLKSEVTEQLSIHYEPSPGGFDSSCIPCHWMVWTLDHRNVLDKVLGEAPLSLMRFRTH